VSLGWAVLKIVVMNYVRNRILRTRAD